MYDISYDMKNFFSIITLLLLIHCTKQENISLRKFEIEKVEFTYPSDWKLTETEGIDSYFSYLSKDGDTIYIEFGMYNPKIYKSPLQDNLFRQVTIDGTESIIEIPKTKYGNFASIYIPTIDSAGGFYMFNKNGNIEDFLRIYQTLKLNKSRRKKPLIIDLKEFKNKNAPPGIVFYEHNCLDCHSEYHYEIGPALDRKFIRSKGRLWFEKYLYSIKQPKEIPISCTQIDEKDSLMVKEMIHYLF
ncbi:hypothetical protein QF024_002446 [Chryseobacterium nepalense]|nr:hypothetical protein [Chryseobacterium nepalense]